RSGAARLLHAHRDELRGDVVFMFQPGEEVCNGASVMIEEGVLEAAGRRAVAAFGAHVNTSPRGAVCTRPGTLQAGSNVLEVTIRGRGGHGSQPQSAVDPVPVLAEAIHRITASASLAATVRTLSEPSLETVRQRSEQLAEHIAAAHGCTAEVTFEVQYPVTVNDAAETAWALERLEGLLGGERVKVLPQPIMPSEDFSFVLRQVPGTYLMLGAGRTDVPADRQGDNHSPFVIFDDSVLADQAAVLAHLALERLNLAD